MAIRFMVAAVAAVLIAGPAQAQERELAMAAAAADRAMMAMDAVQARAREPREAERDQKDRDAERADRQRDQEMAAFDQAYSQMDAGRWDRAVEAFARVAAMKGTRADGALYWQAYSQDRIGQRAEALATIAELAKTYPASRYVKQAQALEMEVHGKRYFLMPRRLVEGGEDFDWGRFKVLKNE